MYAQFSPSFSHLLTQKVVHTTGHQLGPGLCICALHKVVFVCVSMLQNRQNAHQSTLFSLGRFTDPLPSSLTKEVTESSSSSLSLLHSCTDRNQMKMINSVSSLFPYAYIAWQSNE